MAAHPSILENPMDRELAGYSPWGCRESETTEATYVYSTFPHSTSVKILLILKEVSLK